jgi:hypothetical protein
LKGRKIFFFEKKKQKTFITLAQRNWIAPLRTQKFFGSFFQKRTSFSLAEEFHETPEFSIGPFPIRLFSRRPVERHHLALGRNDYA